MHLYIIFNNENIRPVTLPKSEICNDDSIGPTMNWKYMIQWKRQTVGNPTCHPSAFRPKSENSLSELSRSCLSIQRLGRVKNTYYTNEIIIAHVECSWSRSLGPLPLEGACSQCVAGDDLLSPGWRSFLLVVGVEGRDESVAAWRGVE
jgi:hypothetical protein